MTRPSWDETFLQMARAISKRSVLPTRVGAVLVRDRRVVSMGYNGKCSGAAQIHRQEGYQLDEVHAEANAIAFAARVGILTQGAELFVTCRPCIHCAKLLVQSGVSRVVCEDALPVDCESNPDGISLLERFQVEVSLE